jgi:hypothetical protein
MDCRSKNTGQLPKDSRAAHPSTLSGEFVVGWRTRAGAWSSGMGFAWKSPLVIPAMRLAQRLARSRRALSVAMPVLAYI